MFWKQKYGSGRSFTVFWKFSFKVREVGRNSSVFIYTVKIEKLMIQKRGYKINSMKSSAFLRIYSYLIVKT